jgi:hypothetical protein
VRWGAEIAGLFREFFEKYLLIEADHEGRDQDQHDRFDALGDLPHLQDPLEISGGMEQDRRENIPPILIP